MIANGRPRRAAAQCRVLEDGRVFVFARDSAGGWSTGAIEIVGPPGDAAAVGGAVLRIAALPYVETTMPNRRQNPDYDRPMLDRIGFRSWDALDKVSDKADVWRMDGSWLVDAHVFRRGVGTLVAEVEVADPLDPVAIGEAVLAAAEVARAKRWEQRERAAAAKAARAARARGAVVPAAPTVALTDTGAPASTWPELAGRLRALGMWAGLDEGVQVAAQAAVAAGAYPLGAPLAQYFADGEELFESGVAGFVAEIAPGLAAAGVQVDADEDFETGAVTLTSQQGSMVTVPGPLSGEGTDATAGQDDGVGWYRATVAVRDAVNELLANHDAPVRLFVTYPGTNDALASLLPPAAVDALHRSGLIDPGDLPDRATR